MNIQKEEEYGVAETADVLAIRIADTRESTDEEVVEYANAVTSAITSKEERMEFGTYQKQLEKQMIEGVRDLPETLAIRLGTFDPAPYNKRTAEIRRQMKIEKNSEKLSRLQQQLIFSIYRRHQQSAKRW